MKGKDAIKIFGRWVVYILFVTVGFCLNSFAKDYTGTFKSTKVIHVRLVKAFNSLIEPLMVKAVVIKKGNNFVKARVISGSYKGYLIYIKGKFDVKRSAYITGYMYRDEFFVVSFSRRRKR